MRTGGGFLPQLAKPVPVPCIRAAPAGLPAQPPAAAGLSPALWRGFGVLGRTNFSCCSPVLHCKMGLPSQAGCDRKEKYLVLSRTSFSARDAAPPPQRRGTGRIPASQGTFPRREPLPCFFTWRIPWQKQCADVLFVLAAYAVMGAGTGKAACRLALPVQTPACGPQGSIWFWRVLGRHGPSGNKFQPLKGLV